MTDMVSVEQVNCALESVKNVLRDFGHDVSCLKILHDDNGISAIIRLVNHQEQLPFIEDCAVINNESQPYLMAHIKEN